MVISFFGEGCFKIQSGDAVVLTDLPSPQSGLTPPRFKYDVLLKTLTPSADLDLARTKEEFQIIGAGEYNVKGVDVAGFELLKESSTEFIKTIYLMKTEGIKLCFLGHISEMPEADIAEHLEEIDILFVPGGGKPFLEQKAAVKLIKQIEPKIVIPCFHKIPGLKRQSADVKVFLEEGGWMGKAETQEKLTIKKKDLAEIKKTKVVCLKS